MKNSRLPLLLALAGLPLMLTACPRTPYEMPVRLTFDLTDGAPDNLKLAAVSFQVQDDQTVKPVVFSQGYGYNSKTLSISLDKSQLAALSKNTRCTTPFSTGEAKDMLNVSVTPGDVSTCDLFFVAYQDKNGDNNPTSEEERYITHDVYSYASSAFTYSMTSKDGHSTVSGTRTQGWSLVRHTVLQPSATPGKYIVTMNSVPTADESISIRLHEPTNFMTSMSLGGRP